MSATPTVPSQPEPETVIYAPSLPAARVLAFETSAAKLTAIAADLTAMWTDDLTESVGLLAQELLEKCDRNLAQADLEFRGVVDDAHQLHKRLLGKLNDMKAPANEARAIAVQAGGAWEKKRLRLIEDQRRENDRKAREQAQRDADARAADLKRQAEELAAKAPAPEILEQQAQELEARADEVGASDPAAAQALVGQAEELKDKAAEAAGVQQQALALTARAEQVRSEPVIPTQVPIDENKGKVAGSSFREPLYGEVLDKRTLALELLQGTPAGPGKPAVPPRLELFDELFDVPDGGLNRALRRGVKFDPAHVSVTSKPAVSNRRKSKGQ